MGAISRLIRARNDAAVKLDKALAPLWECFAVELGLPRDRAGVPTTHDVDLRDGVVALTYRIALPGRDRRRNRKQAFRIEVPSEVIDGGVPSLQAYLRAAYPVRCLHCGCSLPLGVHRIHGSDCSHRMHWRVEAPQPRYYVDENDAFGYVLPTRGKRFVYDIDRDRLVSLQIECRFNGTWMTPVETIVQQEYRRFQDEVLPGIPTALAGGFVPEVNAAKFAFDLPDWCELKLWLH